MGMQQLEALGLAPARVEAAARFLRAYAEMCLRRQNALLADEQRWRDNLPGEWWSLQVEAASSFCEAGQWAMLTDPRSALPLWRRAGQLFREVDFGFGYYLLTTVGAGDE